MRNRVWSLVTIVTVALAAFCFGTPVTPATAQSAWYAEYFANRDLSGGPALTRYDDTLHFEWGNDSPGSGILADNFSAVWTRAVEFGGGRYTFTTYSDDGVRLYVDGRLVIDSWQPMRGTRTATLNLSKGTHTVPPSRGGRYRSNSRQEEKTCYTAGKRF